MAIDLIKVMFAKELSNLKTVWMCTRIIRDIYSNIKYLALVAALVQDPFVPSILLVS